jgi:hypothetical protein
MLNMEAVLKSHVLPAEVTVELSLSFLKIQSRKF